MTATAISLRDLHRVWQDLWPLLEPAVKRSPDYGAGDRAEPDACPEPAEWVLARLLARDAQLWAIHEKSGPIAAVVTMVQQREDGRHCLLWLIGGSRARDWADDFLARVETWARTLGCVALWGVGRVGWKRIVEPRGFRRIADFEGQPAWIRRIS